MQSFLVALGTLTVIPVRFAKLLPDAVVARSRYWYPVVGLLLAVLMGGWTWLVAFPQAPLLSAFLVVAAWVSITGALHIDGFCDLCDGLFGGRTPERRLEIMKDPRLGTFGLLGGMLLIGGKFAALSVLFNARRAWSPTVHVPIAVLIARCFVLSMAAGARYPREQGTGKVIIKSTGQGLAFLAAAFGVGVIGAWFVGDAGLASRAAGPLWFVEAIDSWILLVCYFVFPAWLAVMVLRVVCQDRLGGITGDCLGAAIELAELTYLLSVAVLAAGSK